MHCPVFEPWLWQNASLKSAKKQEGLFSTHSCQRFHSMAAFYYIFYFGGTMYHSKTTQQRSPD